MEMAPNDSVSNYASDHRSTVALGSRSHKGHVKSSIGGGVEWKWSEWKWWTFGKRAGVIATMH